MDNKYDVPNDTEFQYVIAELARLNAQAEESVGDRKRLDDLVAESSRLNHQIKRFFPADPSTFVAWVMFSLIALSCVASDL